MNLVQNGNFMSGSVGWSAEGGALTVGPADGRDGNAACVDGRTAPVDGLLQVDLVDELQQGGPMSLSAWIKVSSTAIVDAEIVATEGGASEELNVASRQVSSGSWMRLSGYFTLGFSGSPNAISLEFSGPAAGVQLCVADVVVRALTPN